jgi:hypothetical protein
MFTGIKSILIIQDTIFISLFNIFAGGLSMGKLIRTAGGGLCLCCSPEHPLEGTIVQITIESAVDLNYVARNSRQAPAKPICDSSREY